MNGAADVKRVVLTGGPCGGKSTLQAMLSDVFENMGWKVFRVPETATVLLSGGVTFSELSAEQSYQFQLDLLRVMLRIEDTYFHLAQSEAAKGHKVIVICDRGAMDASAYIDRSAWLRILEDVKMTEVELRDQRYDYVAHLVTAANGAAEFYNLSNNHARSEGIELALQLDDMCSRAWVGHPYYDIIDNATPFDKKCHRVIGSLLKRLGLKDKRYGENIRKHKFLVQPSSTVLSDEFPVPFQDFIVEHTFLLTTDGSQSRLRRRTQNSVSHFNLTVRPNGRLRAASIGSSVSPDSAAASSGPVELRRSLGGREYDMLRTQADPNRVPILKRRRCFLWQNNYFQLDCLEQPVQSAGLLILEAYFPDIPGEHTEWKSKLPPFVAVTEEITGKREYSLHDIALLRGAAAQE